MPLPRNLGRQLCRGQILVHFIQPRMECQGEEVSYHLKDRLRVETRSLRSLLLVVVKLLFVLEAILIEGVGIIGLIAQLFIIFFPI